jgi:hypothetical protein
MRVHRAWALAGGGAAGQAAAADDWCRAHGVNARAMRTCSNVRTQLLDILAAADAGASRGAAAAAGATASRAVVADGETDQWRALRQAVCQGFFPHTARAVPAGGGGFRLAGDDAFAVAYVHPSSCLAELLSPPRGAPAAASTPPKSHEWLIYQVCAPLPRPACTLRWAAPLTQRPTRARTPWLGAGPGALLLARVHAQLRRGRQRLVGRPLAPHSLRERSPAVRPPPRGRWRESAGADARRACEGPRDRRSWRWWALQRSGWCDGCRCGARALPGRGARAGSVA